MKKTTLTIIAILISICSYTQNVEYTYDNLKRLESVTYDDSLKIVYSYDELGNRFTKEIIDVYGNLPGCNPYNMTVSSNQYYEGENGVDIHLSGSKIGFEYELIKDDINTGLIQIGTGSFLTWANQLEGTYKVHAGNGVDECFMNGEETVIEIPPHSISLENPNGFEQIQIDSQYLIEWEAISLFYRFSLEYSVDGGNTFFLIDDNILHSEDSYLWNTPALIADECLIRISGFHSDDATLIVQSENYFSLVDCIPILEPVISSEQVICYNTIPEILNRTSDATGGADVINYVWEYSLNNSDWIELAGETNSSYQPDALSETCYYRQKASDGCALVYSNVIQVLVKPELSLSISESQNLCFDENADILSSEVNDGNGAYNFQWQIYETGWEDIVGANTDEYQSPLNDNNEYRLMVTDNCSSYFSNSVEIATYDPLTISNSVDQTICYNTIPEVLSAEVQGGKGDYSIVWQYHNEGDFEDVLNANFLEYQPEALTESMTYRIQITETCGVFYGDPIEVIVMDPLEAVLNSDQNACFNVDPMPLSISPSGADGVYSYQWQMNINNSWETVEIGDEPEYQPIALTTDREFRTIVENQCGDIISNSVLISVFDPILVTANPMEQLVCQGEIPNAIVANPSGGDGDWGFEWIINGEVNAEDSETLSFTQIDESMDIVVVVTNDCGSVESETIHIELSMPLSGGIQNIGGCCYGAAPQELIAAISGGNENNVYQWQISDGNNWFDIAGATALNYQAGNLFEDTDYRITVSNGCDDWQSQALTVEVFDNLAVSLTGEQTICYNETPIEIAAIVTGGDGNYEYTWQWYDGVSWISVDNASYSLLNPGNLTQTTTYRVVVNNLCGEVISNEITIEVLPEIIATVSSDQELCEGISVAETLVLDVENGDANDSYSWQYSNMNDNWTTIQGSNGIYLNPGVLNESRWYRVLIENPQCGEIISDTVTMTVLPPIEVEIDSDQELCPGDDPEILTASVNTESDYDIQWEYEVAAGWLPISGETSNTFNPDVLTETTRYRVHVWDMCTEAYDTVTLLVYNFGDIDLSNDQDICYNEEANPIEVFVNVEAGPLSYQWQKYSGSDWINIAGATSSIYEPGQLVQTMIFRCALSNPCEEIISDELTINVKPELIIEAGEDMLLCGMTPQEVSLNGDASGYTSLQWSSSGSGWFDNDNEPQTIYNLNGLDVINGQITLTLTGEGYEGCNDVVADELIVEFQNMPEVVMGIDDICEDENIIVSANVTDYSSIQWTTSGSGSFNNSTSLITTYQPSIEDIETGSLVFYLEAEGVLPCTQSEVESETVQIYRIPQAPNAPTGQQWIEIEPGGTTTSVYTIEEVANAEDYIWSINPANAGTIIGSGSEVIVEWIYQDDLTSVELRAQSRNELCDGDMSEPLTVYLGDVVVENTMYESLVEISPNPNNGVFSISMMGFSVGYYTIAIYDGNGKTIYDADYKINNTRKHVNKINLSNIASGEYFVKIQNQSDIIVRKIVIQ
jgi:hypothetical protein